VGAVCEALGRVSQMALDLPELAEVDMNPVIVTSQGVNVVDIKIRVVPHPVPSRHLRSLHRSIWR
jgi:acetyltransferase